MCSSCACFVLDVLQGVSRKDPASFGGIFFFWTGWGPLCNPVNGALHVGNVSEARAALRLAGRANSPIAQPLPSPQKPGVLRRSGWVSIATATSGMELRVNVSLLFPSPPPPALVFGHLVLFCSLSSQGSSTCCGSVKIRHLMYYLIVLNTLACVFPGKS